MVIARQSSITCQSNKLLESLVPRRRWPKRNFDTSRPVLSMILKHYHPRVSSFVRLERAGCQKFPVCPRHEVSEVVWF